MRNASVGSHEACIDKDSNHVVISIPENTDWLSDKTLENSAEPWAK